ncbi:hypothetical protein HMPREF1578_01306 [Gardnerella pickettii JCP8017B]|nr:hypothetical protein HMPREF1578_01306 [Gardnerella pickettii JCP8017B]
MDFTFEPNHALKELEMRYAISSSVKTPMQVDSRHAASLYHTQLIW